MEAALFRLFFANMPRTYVTAFAPGLGLLDRLRNIIGLIFFPCATLTDAQVDEMRSSNTRKPFRVKVT